MSGYENKMRLSEKDKLAQRVHLAVVNDIWEKSLTAKDSEEFLDYLMTIEDENAIEEFFNQCHGEGGRFCGGGTSSRGISGKNRGPGTHHPAPVDYFKTNLSAARNTLKQRYKSDAVKDVTTGPVRGLLTRAVGLPATLSSVKVNKLSNTDLSKFSDKDLNVVKSRLQSNQRFYNTMRTGRWILSASPVPVYALSIWKTKRIPGQIKRIDSELKKRGSKVSASSEFYSFDVDETLLYSFEQEFAAAEAKNLSSSAIKPSQAELEAIAFLLANIEDDDDITPEVKKQITDYFG